MTAQTIVDNIRLELKIDPQKGVWSDPLLLKYMNQGLKYISTETDFQQDITSATTVLVDGTATYSLPTEFIRFLQKSIVFTDADSNKSKPEVIDYADLVNDVLDTTETDDYPKYIYTKANTFGIYPVPNATMATGTFSYEYYSYIEDYELADTVVFPENYMDVLENYATYRAFASIPGKKEEAMLSYEEFSLGLKRMKIQRIKDSGPYFTFKTIPKPHKN